MDLMNCVCAFHRFWILAYCDNISIFVPEFIMEYFLIFMKRLHPAYYFDTVILIFCYHVPYVFYHFTS